MYKVDLTTLFAAYTILESPKTGDLPTPLKSFDHGFHHVRLLPPMSSKESIAETRLAAEYRMVLTNPSGLWTAIIHLHSPDLHAFHLEQGEDTVHLRIAHHGQQIFYREQSCPLVAWRITHDWLEHRGVRSETMHQIRDFMVRGLRLPEAVAKAA